MEAVVLSAGQGRRLLPLTKSLPKCLLQVAPGGGTVLDVQLDTLSRCGIEKVTVMVGFGAEQVEQHLAEHKPEGLDVELVLNPLHPHSDNLVSAWLATFRVEGDFVLLNGDTLFEAEVLQRMIAAEGAKVGAAVDCKDAYDLDDMCVWVEDGNLVGIGKGRRETQPDGEAIGIYVFRGRGVSAARDVFARVIAEPEGLHSWYPPALETLARVEPITPVSIEGLWWTEIDFPEDLEKARVEVGSHFAQADPWTAPSSQSD
ncbi:MAG: phosphocholine cytidylyltransferase family protein [Deltaproteobacteria bacterium]|nr:phosphocholine cytidylyltransferase family protein [Deltaproteobacteria bacterium]MBW2446797.1 phosphocholine cytidylyltransferase family protein [Deltaproteobacteria bacterium]